MEASLLPEVMESAPEADQAQGNGRVELIPRVDIELPRFDGTALLGPCLTQFGYFAQWMASEQGNRPPHHGP